LPVWFYLSSEKVPYESHNAHREHPDNTLKNRENYIACPIGAERAISSNGFV
jgi:hypothetical protein